MPAWGQPRCLAQGTRAPWPGPRRVWRSPLSRPAL